MGANLTVSGPDTADDHSERVITPAAERLASLLQVGDLVTPSPCHGYANACTCLRCSDRDERRQHLGNQPRAAELAKRDSDERFGAPVDEDEVNG